MLPQLSLNIQEPSVEIEEEIQTRHGGELSEMEFV